MKCKLEGQTYGKEEEFRDDVMLTFDNALTYNSADDPCYQAAVKLKGTFKDIWGTKFYECDKCSKTFWWSVNVYDDMIANHARKHCAGNSVPSYSGSFERKKDQGWGELLDSKFVKTGDTICAPRRPRSRSSKGRYAEVQRDGTLLENGTERWIDPVAFCVSNNTWKESGSYLKDRNRFSNCTRICASTKQEEKLRDLKDEARGRYHDSQGDDEESHATNLAPVQGATVKVRMEVDKAKIVWLDGKLTKRNKNGEWDIKLQFCAEAPEERQGQCHGCSECLFKLALDDRGW